jgi:predicted ATP-grasp superfamily ATP-dependent carboligase
VTDHPLAIVLGVDTPIGLTVIRELGSHGVPVHAVGRSKDAIGRASKWTTSFSVRPAGPLDAWLPALIEETGAAALLAVSENDLIALSALDPVIGGCKILTPRAAPLAIVLDKVETLKRAKNIGIDVPDSWQPVPGDNFKSIAATLAYPLVLKWADPPAILPHLAGHAIAFVKAEYIGDAADLLSALSRYDALGIYPLAQSYCGGVGLGQMFHIAGGAATLRFQHRRIHEWPPEGGVSTVCATVPLEQHVGQRAKSESLLANIGWEGPAMVEYRYDARADKYWLMEINGRFWGSLPLARQAGAEFAWETYAQSMGIATEPPEIRERHARYTIPETRRLLRILFDRRAISDRQFKATPWRDLFSYLGDFIDPGMRYFVWDRRDPRPFFADMKGVLRKFVRRETPSQGE